MPIKTVIAIIGLLPEIIRLVENLQKRIEENELERKVKDDLNKINQAFEKKDADLLYDIFSGK